MTGKNHLGTNKELTEFSIEMATQLNVHRNEKQSMREWGFERVMLNNLPEIQDRLITIKNCLDKIRHKEMYPEKNILLYLEEIAKQSVHIANYCMMSRISALQYLGSGIRK